MVILTLTTTENPHTVYFDQPIQNPSYIRLLSCSLYNSWFNLKEGSKIFYTNETKKLEKSESILPGNYTIEEMAKKIENSFKKYGDILRTQINTPVGQMFIQKVDPLNDKIKFDKNLSELLGIDKNLQWIRYVKRMKSPTTYFIHCDLVDKEQNLVNGKPSTVLQTFDITGKAYEKVFYQSGPEHVLREVSADNYITNMTISVREENNDLFNFNQEPLQFLIEIN